MAIKMRNNKDSNSICCECGHPRKEVLDMFDLCIGGNVFTFCDECNEQIFYKTLKADCAKNARVKTPEDMRIIRKRANGSHKSKWYLKHEEERLAAEKKSKEETNEGI